jgi:hypothetical protein
MISRSLQTDLEIKFEAKMMEIFKNSSLRKPGALVLLICATLLGGCSAFSFKQPDPVTIGQVIQMNKDGVPADSIIKTMRDSDTVYRLTAAQLAELHDMGLPDQVLNYMQQTYIDAERRQQSAEDWDSDYTWGTFDW